jgi:hypothetical protein
LDLFLCRIALFALSPLGEDATIFVGLQLPATALTAWAEKRLYWWKFPLGDWDP